MATEEPQQRVLLPSAVTPSHYEVHLSPDFEAFTFAGTSSVAISVNTSDVKQIVLHALELEITSAIFVGADGVEVACSEISYQKEKIQTATFAFGASLPEGKAVLRLVFSGVLNDKMCGFYRSTYEVDGVKKVMATTQFEATDARRAFPCWDEPALKATFSFTLTVPKHMTAVSNMPVERTTAGPSADTKTVAFQKTVVMSTYLGAFVVGEMNFIEGASPEGIPCRVYATAGKETQGQFALDVCGKVLSFFGKYFGIAYPLPKMDMLAIPDFSAGAMENYGCVTYRETAILWDPAKSAASAKQRVAYVVAHELAHQWFGNLTTMQWWDNLWLNEGFATFVGTMAVHELFPEWDMFTQFVTDDWALALDLDSMKSSHPIQVEVFSADQVSEIFDAISYYKGASVIRSVYDWIGEAAFRAGLRAYLAKFSYANTVTDDLWNAWGDASGLPVRAVMSSWTLQTGYPLVTVKEVAAPADDGSGGGGTVLHVEQQRFFKDGSGSSGGGAESQALWSIPISVRGPSSSSKQYTMLESAEGVVPMPAAAAAEGGAGGGGASVAATWVKVNPSQTGVYRVRYSPELLAKLKPGVGSLPTADRIGLVGDAFALATAGLTPVVDVLEFLLGFVDETDYTVWSSIASGLAPIKQVLATDPDAYAALKRFTRTLFGKVAASVGWEKVEGEAHTQSLKRALVLKAMAGADDEATHATASLKWQELKANPASEALEPDLKGVVYSLAAANGGEEAFEALLRLATSPSTMAEERVRLITSLGSTKDPKLLARTLSLVLDAGGGGGGGGGAGASGAAGASASAAAGGGVRPQDSMYCVAGVALNLVHGRAFAWQWMKDNWDALFEKYGTGGSFTLPRLVSYSTKFLVTNQDADDVEAFFASHSVEGAARTVAQSVEAIRTAAAMHARDGEALKVWLLARPA